MDMELRDIYIQIAMFIWRIHDVRVDLILPNNAGIFPSLQPTERVDLVLVFWMVLRDSLLQALRAVVPL